MTEKFIQHTKFIVDVLKEKTISTTMGKKWKGEILIKVNIYEGGITSTECEATEKINKK